MLLYRLKEIELHLKDQDLQNIEPLQKAAKNLQQSLLQVDYRVEDFPGYSEEMLYPVLEELLGRDLTTDEHKVIGAVLKSF